MNAPTPSPRERTDTLQAPELDATDRALITLLADDGRASVAALAQSVHISRGHAHQRLNRLRDAGIITGFRVTLDPAAIGLRSSAYVTLKLRQHSWRSFRAALRRIPEVHHVALVGGAFDVILLVRAADNAALRGVVFDVLQAMPEVVDTQTHLIFEDVETGFSEG